MGNELYDRSKEIGEAISAADRALYALTEAKTYLDKARGWGMWDILGGGFFSTFMKHARMNDAEDAIAEAKRAVADFSRELRDVEDLSCMNINTGDFLSFADYFWDGAIADLMMQSRINKSRRQVDEAISRIRDIRNRLASF